MANFGNLETDFIKRTLELISQYESIMRRYEFEKQFNHTLLVNCLLGLIVFPKERTITYLPTNRITSELKKEMGIVESTFNADIKDLRELVIALRHTIAHFDITFESDDREAFLIDRIVFRDQGQGADYIVACFVPSELLNFLRYYGDWVVKIIQDNRGG